MRYAFTRNYRFSQIQMDRCVVRIVYVSDQLVSLYAVYRRPSGALLDVVISD